MHSVLHVRISDETFSGRKAGKRSMNIHILAAAINIVIDPIFIYILDGD